MSGWEPLGRSLLFLGLILALAGGLILLAGKIPFLGKLPGDIFIQRKNFSFCFPLATSLVLSVILSLVFALIRRR